MGIFQTPFGSLRLDRFPVRRSSDALRAWDTADEYLLQHLYTHFMHVLDAGLPPLIANDEFGALACALYNYQPIHWTDSFLSHRAAQENAVLNNLGNSTLYLDSLATPAVSCQLALIRIPKATALLEDQLARLKPALNQNSVVIAAGMVKHMPPSAFRAFEKYIGPVTTSLAWKKSRLIFSTPDQSLCAGPSPYPSTYSDELSGYPLINHANVFSRERLDGGARYFLQHLNRLPEQPSEQPLEIIDLACGNGILGLHVQQCYPKSRLEFVDCSYMAIDSARQNHAQWCESVAPNVVFTVANGLEFRQNASADLIVCNPPFHQGYVVGESVARSMFKDARRCLRAGGELWIVANKHLKYQPYLNKLFGHCEVIAAERRFVILRACQNH